MPNQQVAEGQPQEEEQQNQGGQWPSIWKMVLAYFLITQAMNFFTGSKNLAKKDVIDQEGNPVILKDKLQNLFYFENPFNLTGYISAVPYYKQDRKAGSATHNSAKMKKVFSATNLDYSYNEGNYLDFNVSFPVSEKFLEKNATMYLHLDIEADYRFAMEDMYTKQQPFVQDQIYSDARYENDGQKIIMHRSIPLVKYAPKSSAKKMVNLLGEPTDKEEESDEEVEESEESKKYIQHLKPEIYCYFAPDSTVYGKASIPEQMRNLFKINTNMNYYEPLFLCTDFWLYHDILTPLNETIKVANTTVHIQPYSLTKLVMFDQFEKTNSMYKEWGINNDMDMFKQMIAETNFYFLVLTMAVSLAHTACEFLAFKNEIHFWKNRDSMKGISVRTLFINLVMSVIIFLYLLDKEKETSMMILAPAGIGIIIEIWKISRAMKVSSIDTFPYISVEDKESYKENDTNKYDRIAMTYLSYAMYPLLACYAVYSLMYEEHKGWYSYIINTLVGAVYVFGFITMTPQLYINYKLKSVEHLPWRVMVYRFLNTIIDDLFSFIITMPTMHRLSCFRDDIIFVIYLYQRWIYRVDNTRDPYGQFSKEDEQAKEALDKMEVTGNER